MRGEFAEFAEVVCAGDDAAAKDMMPETIDDDACGERIALHVGHVPGEFESTAAGGVEGRGIERVKEAALDDLGGLLVIAAHEQRGVFGVRFNDSGHAGGRGQFGFEVAVAFD